MPNTPALVGAGISAVANDTGVDAADLERACAVLRAVGSVVQVPESALDAVTGLSGSGPAYVFAFVEALTEAGVREGLPLETARALALETVHGAARLALESGEDPAVLRARVTSPGGTTVAGLAALARRRLPRGDPVRRARRHEALEGARRVVARLVAHRSSGTPASRRFCLLEMRLTPLEIRQHRFTTRFRGFDAGEVEAFLETVVADFEDVVRENAQLRREAERLARDLDAYRAREKTIQDTLTTAQAVVEQLKRTAIKESETLVVDAELRAEKIVAEARERRAELAQRDPRAEVPAPAPRGRSAPHARGLREADRRLRRRRADEPSGPRAARARRLRHVRRARAVRRGGSRRARVRVRAAPVDGAANASVALSHALGAGWRRLPRAPRAIARYGRSCRARLPHATT